MKVNKNDPKSVGMRIRNIRQIIGDTMEQFASKIDSKAKSGTVSNWETGKNLPNNKRLTRIAELGGVTVDYLLEGKSFTKDFSIIPKDQKKEYLTKVKNSQKYNVLHELTKYNTLDDFSNQEAGVLDTFFRFLNSSLDTKNPGAISGLSILLTNLNSINEALLSDTDSFNLKDLELRKKLHDMSSQTLYDLVSQPLKDKIDKQNSI